MGKLTALLLNILKSKFREVKPSRDGGGFTYFNEFKS